MASAVEALFHVLEERLAMPSATESRETLAALLAPEFREIGASGQAYSDVSAVLDALVPGGRPRLVFENFRAVRVSASTVLVTHRSKSTPGPGWRPPSWRSSLWVSARDAGCWCSIRARVRRNQRANPVAIYHLSVKPISRAGGRSATAAAAYRSGELVHDVPSGETFDYTRKRGVGYTEIVLPTAAAKQDINWAGIGRRCGMPRRLLRIARIPGRL